MNVIRLSGGTALVLGRLRAAGCRAYAVGGCVRDSLLGLTPQDWDVCTDATPARVIALFGEAHCIPTGVRHGTVTVRAAGELIEVTTFRVEGAYSDGRHPDEVAFVGDVREDLARRDFTVNAMAYDEASGLIDPFVGRADLARGVLRAVGDPQTRFEEDALRILRLFRFGARLGFAPEPRTLDAALALAGTLSRVSAERIWSELAKLLCAPKPGAYLPAPVARVCLPEALAGGEEAYALRLRALDALTPCLQSRLAALLCGAGERGAREALLRLRCPGETLRRTALLVSEAGLSPEGEERALRVQARRCLGRMEIGDLERLCALRGAQRAAGMDAGDDLSALLAQARACAARGECVSVRGLAVNGDELARAAGISGPALGAMLRELLDRVIEETLPNEKDALLAYAAAHAK